MRTCNECNWNINYNIISFPGQPGIRSRFATLTVLVPPEQPKILQGDFMVTTEDREIELECISVGGKPAAEVRLSAFNVDNMRSVLFNLLFCARAQYRNRSIGNRGRRGMEWGVVETFYIYFVFITAEARAGNARATFNTAYVTEC